jgi:two-component system phosphate regulon sensor histidine kinase PhoR
VETIITNGQRLATMIRDLVDMVRLESGQVQLARQRVELEPFVRTLAQRLAGTLQMDRVRLSFEPALPPLSADPDRLERVLVNLTSNALKYSRPPSEVVLQTQRDGRFVRIEFIDHGIGIPADELPHLFERFFRTRDTRPQEGLGLGLYITAMLVRAHGGTIEVESEPGRGSVFRVRLPLEQQAG